MRNDINFNYKGKRVLITGSTRGLGLAYAEAFAEAGAEVVLNGRNPERLEAAGKKLTESGYSPRLSSFDVTDQKSVNEAVHYIEKNWGPIDILVNNAGVNIRGHFLEVDFDDWNKVLQTNLYSTFFAGQAVARYMAERKKGKIINICSLLSEAARPGIPAYTASKGGVKMLTKAMAIDLAKYNIQVNGLGPGYIATEMNLPLKEDEVFDKWLTNRTPMGRWAEENELCGTILFLASEESDFLTGQIIYVDGGIISSL